MPIFLSSDCTFFNYSSFTLSDSVNFLLQLNPITYSSLIRYQKLFFTPYQSPACGCKAALCTQNPRHEKTYLQGLATL